MKVFVTGATGFIGSAIVRELIDAGHKVVGMARSEASAQSLITAGAQVHRGTLEDLESLSKGAAASDGVIHTAFIHDFSHMPLSARISVLFGGLPSSIVSRFVSTITEIDQRVVKTLGTTLSGSDRPLVVAAGTLSLAPNHLGIEDDRPDQNGIGAPRIRSEEAALAMVSQRVRASVIRLSPSVHGNNNGKCQAGLVTRLIATAHKKRVSAYVGNGLNRWPAIHHLDAAHLFRLALEKGSAGACYHGVAEEGVSLREIAEAIGRHLNIPVTSLDRKKASRHFGIIGNFIDIDNPTSSQLTQERLGWRPTHPALIPDLDQNPYFNLSTT
jgi:nucleoside-diphosphate-sugar epimerase